MTTHIATPKDRTFSRTQGCWNCKHSGSATAFWTEARQRDLATAIGIAQDDPQGEESLKVKNIRHMIDTTDHQVALGTLIRCSHGRKPNGDPVGDLVAHNYLCSRWSAKATGLDRDIGKTDKLPEELVEDLDGKGPKEVSNLAGLLGRKIVT